MKFRDATGDRRGWEIEIKKKKHGLGGYQAKRYANGYRMASVAAMLAAAF